MKIQKRFLFYWQINKSFGVKMMFDTIENFLIWLTLTENVNILNKEIETVIA